MLDPAHSVTRQASTGLPVRTARMISVGCAIAWMALIVCAVGMVVTDHVRRQRASTVAKPGWTQFDEHGKAYFAPPDVARWRERFGTAFPILLLTCGCALVVSHWAAVESDAIGRPWRRISPRQ